MVQGKKCIDLFEMFDPLASGLEEKRDRQTDRDGQTDRQTERETETENLLLCPVNRLGHITGQSIIKKI